MRRNPAVILIVALAGCGTAPSQRSWADRDALRDSLNAGAPRVSIARLRLAGTERGEIGDGRYQTVVKLASRTGRVVPELSIRAKTSNGARISDIVLTGVGVEEALTAREASADGTERSLVASNVRADELEARIITEGDPGQMTVRISPLEQ